MKHSIVVFVMCATPVKMHGPEARARDIGWKSMPPTIVRSSATLATYTYDWLHFTQRRVKTTATVATYVTHKLEYDSYNRIRRITNLGEPNGRYVLLAAFDYTYDIVGNRVSTIGEGNQAADPDVTYDYDGLYRLTEAQYPDLGGSETFRYDKLGNRDGDGTGDVYGYTDTRYGTPSGAAEIAYGTNNAVNEYDSIAGVTVNYDAAGNLAKDEKGLSYEYDLDNKLTRIYDDDNADGNWDSGEDRYLEFAYDALGRRIQTTDYANSQSNPKITRFYHSWDGTRWDENPFSSQASSYNVISEYVYNGSTYDLTRWYIHGPTYIDERVIVKDVANSKEYYYFQKELYSVAGLADKDGKLKEAYAYDAYGKVRIYQPNPIAGDSDSDKDVDLEDFAAFANCFDEDVTVNTGCAWANVIDESSDIVDLDDYGAVYPCMTGPFAPLFATGDWNGDSQVNTTDLTAFMTCWLSTPTDSTCLTKFDFDATGLIDLEDYGVMLSLVYPTTATCLTPVLVSMVNPYFFDGLGSPGKAAGDQRLIDARARSIDAHEGRFLQRDPLHLMRDEDLALLNYDTAQHEYFALYVLLGNQPTRWVDPTGLYEADTHHGRTEQWAIRVGMSKRGASWVGRSNIATDSGATGFFPWIGEQSRHFNRNSGASDTRLDWRDYEFKRAKELCLPAVDDHLGAGIRLGRSLHSIQDWWAHGDYSKGPNDVIWPHAWSWPPSRYDDWDFDAATADGRAPQVFKWRSFPSLRLSEVPYTNWITGTKRNAGTQNDSELYLRNFLWWLRGSGGPKCRCFFLEG